MRVRLTELQREMLLDISESNSLNGFSLDGIVQHNRANALERKGLIKVDLWSYAKLTDAGRSIILKGQQHDK